MRKVKVLLLLMLAGCATAPPGPPGPVTAWGYRLDSALDGSSAMIFSKVKEECEALLARAKVELPKKFQFIVPGVWTGCRQAAITPASSGGWYSYTLKDSMFGRPIVLSAATVLDHCEGLRQRVIIYSPTPCVRVTLHFLDGKP
jgi:hypothetical protein